MEEMSPRSHTMPLLLPFTGGLAAPFRLCGFGTIKATWI